MKTRLKKYDLIFFVTILVLIIIAFFLKDILTSKKGNSIKIVVSNKTIGNYPLSKDRTIEIKDKNHITNIVIIKDGYAYMKEADCPDHICKSMKKISKVNESIVCLPNEVFVTVCGDDKSKYDSFTN
jgi:hypothetical protein